MYNGRFCDCCKSGPCQTHCFNRYAPEDGEEEDMCSESGKCSCYERSVDAKQRVGEKCKVKIVLMFSVFTMIALNIGIRLVIKSIF